jgi:membrane protease YdiL (CAAX protease family)
VIRRWGFAAGNTVQAVLFGLIHLLLLLTPNATTGFVLLLVVLTGVLGWILGWINERFANASILPGWAAHGGGNLAAYLLLASGV